MFVYTMTPHNSQPCPFSLLLSDLSSCGPRLVDAFVDQAPGSCFCIVTAPLCQGGNLESVLSQKDGSPPYDLPTALRWALEVSHVSGTDVVSMEQAWMIRLISVILTINDSKTANYGKSNKSVMMV